MKATTQTIGAILGVFAIQTIAVGILGIIPMKFFTLALPFGSDPWTIVLSVYSHTSVGHLVSNLVALLILGLIVERVTNITRFHIFFLLTGVLSSFTQLIYSQMFSSTTVAVIGASGAIFALMGYAIVGNNLTSNLISYLNIGRIGTVFIIISLATIITVMTASEGVALISHASGFIIGALSGYFRLLHTN